MTINNSVYYESGEHIDTIIDSSKQVDASNDTIKENHMVNRVCNLSVEVVSFETAVIGVKIIEQGITQGIINGDTKIGSNIVTDVFMDYSKILFDTNTFQFNTLQSETLVIGPQDESMKRNNRVICMPSDSRNIRGNQFSRIDTPGVNKDIWSVMDTTSNVPNCKDNVKKFDAMVQISTSQERNLESFRIEEESVKVSSLNSERSLTLAYG